MTFIYVNKNMSFCVCLLTNKTIIISVKIRFILNSLHTVLFSLPIAIFLGILLYFRSINVTRDATKLFQIICRQD